jgi:tetratricopeptide (TPR) repeat protein
MFRTNAVSRLLLNISALCAEAHRLRRLGHYEQAAALISEVWPEVGGNPLIENLAPKEAAEVLLICGLLTGQLGRARGLTDAQERAKDLLTESQRLFELAGDRDGAGEALSAQGYCCTRAGALDDARVFLQQALSQLSKHNRMARAEAVMRLVAVTEKQHQPSRALRLLQDNYTLFNRPLDPDLRRMFHCTLAASLTWLLRQTERPEDAAHALRELRTAKDLCAEVDQRHFLMMVENNSAFALIYLREFREAHDCLDRADALAACETRPEWALSLRETRTLVLMAEGRLREAEELIEENLTLLEGSEHKGLLCESLITQGEIFAGSGRFDEARTSFLRAIEIGEFIGDLSAVERASEQLQRIAKLASLADARARTFVWQQSDDSMIDAGICPGRYYRFLEEFVGGLSIRCPN